MKKISRDNTNKANINNNIFNTVGIPLSYAANLVDDLIFILSLFVMRTDFIIIEKKSSTIFFA